MKKPRLDGGAEGAQIGFACTCITRQAKSVQVVFPPPRPWILCGDRRHEKGGEWTTSDKFVTVHLKHILESNPHVADVLSLPPSFHAEWDAARKYWIVSTSRVLTAEEIRILQYSARDGELNTDTRFVFPDEIGNLTEAQRQDHCTLADDFAQLDQRFFIRALVLIPLLNRDSDFCINVWVEVDRTIFFSYYEVFDQPKSRHADASGKLANNVQPYARTQGLRVILKFGDGSCPPVITFGDELHQLAIDVRTGLDDTQHAALLLGMGFLSHN